MGKFIELAKILQKRKINIDCVQETRWVGSRARNADGYKLWYSGGRKGKNIVGIWVDRELRESVVEVRRVNDRLTEIKLVVGGITLNVISAEVAEKLFIGRDFNGHIGSCADGYSEVHGGFDFGDRNEGGKVEAKKIVYLRLVKSTNKEERRVTRGRYKEAKKEAKLAVTEAKDAAFGRLYEELGDKRGEKKLFRLAKARERKARNLDQVRCIKDEEGRVLTKDAQIKRRWQDYFYRLMNEEGDRDIVLGELGHCGSHQDFRTKRMPDEWRWSTMIPLFKNKCDIQNCNNYRGIKLLSHTIKVWEMMVEGRKAYDKVLREVLWRCLEGKCVLVAYIMVLKDMYEGAKTRVRTVGGDSEHFPDVMGLHQGKQR
ncbi:uncharacterized protein LOC142175859 [Nicotiana tabacum]|uniref:Uncharacterized protein LOC142175859 n=1 Tax=Nicotiana tabacum TaxID=4097 RepID=A0AC58TP06_TOBAC